MLVSGSHISQFCQLLDHGLEHRAPESICIGGSTHLPTLASVMYPLKILACHIPGEIATWNTLSNLLPNSQIPKFVCITTGHGLNWVWFYPWQNSNFDWDCKLDVPSLQACGNVQDTVMLQMSCVTLQAAQTLILHSFLIIWVKGKASVFSIM